MLNARRYTLWVHAVIFSMVTSTISPVALARDPDADLPENRNYVRKSPPAAPAPTAAELRKAAHEKQEEALGHQVAEPADLDGTKSTSKWIATDYAFKPKTWRFAIGAAVIDFFMLARTYLVVREANRFYKEQLKLSNESQANLKEIEGEMRNVEGKVSKLFAQLDDAQAKSLREYLDANPTEFQNSKFRAEMEKAGGNRPANTSTGNTVTNQAAGETVGNNQGTTQASTQSFITRSWNRLGSLMKKSTPASVSTPAPAASAAATPTTPVASGTPMVEPIDPAAVSLDGKALYQKLYDLTWREAEKIRFAGNKQARGIPTWDSVKDRINFEVANNGLLSKEMMEAARTHDVTSKEHREFRRTVYEHFIKEAESKRKWDGRKAKAFAATIIVAWTMTLAVQHYYAEDAIANERVQGAMDATKEVLKPNVDLQNDGLLRSLPNAMKKAWRSVQLMELDGEPAAIRHRFLEVTKDEGEMPRDQNALRALIMDVYLQAMVEGKFIQKRDTSVIKKGEAEQFLPPDTLEELYAEMYARLIENEMPFVHSGILENDQEAKMLLWTTLARQTIAAQEGGLDQGFANPNRMKFEKMDGIGPGDFGDDPDAPTATGEKKEGEPAKDEKMTEGEPTKEDESEKKEPSEKKEEQSEVKGEGPNPQN